MTQKITAYPVVVVDWVDSGANNRWRDELCEPEIIESRSVGFLIRKNKSELVLCNSTNELGHYAGTIAIPVACIRHVERMAKKHRVPTMRKTQRRRTRRITT